VWLPLIGDKNYSGLHHKMDDFYIINQHKNIGILTPNNSVVLRSVEMGRNCLSTKQIPPKIYQGTLKHTTVSAYVGVRDRLCILNTQLAKTENHIFNNSVVLRSVEMCRKFEIVIDHAVTRADFSKRYQATNNPQFWRNRFDYISRTFHLLINLNTYERREFPTDVEQDWYYHHISSCSPFHTFFSCCLHSPG